jgi:OmpA-OmpF porin, OOP family
MTCNWRRWLWGLIPVALLTWLAVTIERPGLEADLTSRVERELKGTGFAWARSAFEGRDGILTGTATDESDATRIESIARSIPGVRTVQSQVSLIEKADNYTWGAARTGNKLRLRGLVPNENTRTAILGVAKQTFPGVDVEDGMKLARGVPSQDTWLSGVTFGLKQLSALKSGDARLDGLGLAVNGEASSVANYTGVKSALAQMPRGVRLIDEKVTPPMVKPYTWAAKVAPGQLTLSGHVPSEAARKDLFAAAKAAFPKSAVVDRMDLADGAVDGWPAAAQTGVKELARLEDGSGAEIRDGQLTVTGLAADESAADAAKKGVRSALPASYKFTDQIRFREPTIKSYSPYPTAATLENGVIILSGYAPSPAAKAAAVEAARQRFPGRRVDDRLEIGAGAPEGWQRCLDGGLLGLARLGNGRLQMTDRRLDVAATTDDENLAEAVPRDVKAATRSDCDSNVRVDILAFAEPDLNWRAAYSGRDVVLEGDVPNAATKASLVQAAARLFPGVPIADRMRVVDARTKGWPKTAEGGLKILSELTSGEATLKNQQLLVQGEAKDNRVLGTVREQITREVGQGYAGREQVTVAFVPPPAPPAIPKAPDLEPAKVAAPKVEPVKVEPPKVDDRLQQCQSGLKSIAVEGTIQFQRASADITPASFATLDKLAGVARACPKAKIEIEGHTDSEGTPERNQRLSDRRAQSVVEYLARGGVDADKLQAVGYGDTRPLVPNDTSDNRAKNRRIEFTVRAE